MTLTNYIAKQIKDVYDFSGYEISAERLKQTEQRISKIVEARGLSREYVEGFFTRLNLGEFGLLYKSPMHIVVLFSEYTKKNKVTREMFPQN